MENKLPGITIPGEATHYYENKGNRTYYKVRLQRNIYRFFDKVWFWDVYRNVWVRSYCYPSIVNMTKIGG